jgi:membrane protein
MKERIKNYIVQSQLYQIMVTILKKIRLRKRNVSLYSIVIILYRKIRKDELLDRSYSVAFSFTLAIFPLIIFLFTLVPYIHNFVPEIDVDTIMEFLQSVMPPTTYNAASSTIKDIISRQRGDLLSFGFLLAFFLATNGVLSLMSIMNRIHKTVENRGFFKSRLIATFLTFILAFVLFTSILLLIAGQVILEFMVDNGIILESLTVYLIIILRFIVVFIIFQLAISFIYYFGPAVHDKLHFFSPGSVVATLLSIAVSFGFSYYITSFGTYNKIYGSIGALIALMIWLSMLSLILLIGYELNAAIDKASRKDYSG